ncbi:MAG: hypothetical protein JW850_13780 [Thermoflexales bacterium]|nr:hypothetical protein [Thermoflexales bacterium]
MKSTTYLALAVLYTSIVNLVFGVQAIAQWPYLSSLPVRMPLAWLIAGKLAWGVVFGVIAWGVWRLAAWGRKAVLAGVVLYQLHIWVNHILFDTSDYARQVWPFAAGMSLVTIGLVWGFMFLPAVHRLYEHRS